MIQREPKSLLSWAPAMLVMMLGAWGGGQEWIAHAGEPAQRTATIVISKEATRVERFAAGELERYLEAVTGREATITNRAPEPGSKLVYWVGNLEAGKDRLGQEGYPLKRIGNAKLVEDGVCIDGDQREVLLVGLGERGALNAVYTYLEDVLGCYWPEPGKEYVPVVAGWRAGTVRRVVNPQLAYRGIGIHGRCTKEFFAILVDWLAKNRMNAFQLFPATYETYRPYVLEAVLDRGLMPNIGAHSREFFLPTRKYRPGHPDWFAKTEGEKTQEQGSGSEQLCYSDYGSVETYASNVLAAIRAWPETRIVGLWPNDGYGFCACTNCRNFPGNPTDLLLSYVNRVAERIHAGAPEVKVEFLAYIVYLNAPEKVKPLPYVVPTFCEHYGAIGARDHWHPITDDRAANKVLREALGKWIAMSQDVTEFSYYGTDSFKRFLYHPLADVIVADCAYYHRVGLAGNVVELGDPLSWWSHALTIYAYTRAAWDGQVTSLKIEREYYESLYGDAAGAMRRHAQAVEQLYEVSPEMVNSKGSTPLGAINIEGKNYDEVLREYAGVIKRADGALAEARRMTTDQRVRTRLEKLQSDTDYLDLWFQIQCGQLRLERDKSAKLRDHILNMINAAFRLDVVTNDDAQGYRTVNGALNTASNSVSSTACLLP